MGYVPDSLDPAALQVIAVYMSQSALFKTLNLFPPEKNLVSVERAKGSYAVLPYFLSKVLAEMPVAAVYPVVFSAVVYPMTGLQATVRCCAVSCSALFQDVLSNLLSRPPSCILCLFFEH
jgi:hypothetical protein